MSNSSTIKIFTPSKCHNCSKNCIHAAAQCQDLSSIKDLQSKLGAVESKILVNETDEQGRTPLHLANITKCSCNCCLDKAELTVKFLLSIDGIDINVQDNDGDTPLHLAIRYGNTKSGKLLVAANADVTLRNHRGRTPLCSMAETAAEIMEVVLNRSVTVEKSYPNFTDCVLAVDFMPLIRQRCFKTSSTEFPQELAQFSYILSSSKACRQMILTHPVTSLFLDQKWKRTRGYFGLRLFLYLFWLLSFTSFIIKVYLVSCPCKYFTSLAKSSTSMDNKPVQINNEQNLFKTEEENPEYNRCYEGTGFSVESVTLLVLTGFMIKAEIIRIISAPSIYYKNKLNLISWLLLTVVLATVGPVIVVKKEVIEQWLYQLAAFAVFLSWAFILRTLGTFPVFGRYIEIFGHVLRNFSLSMLTFSTLFMAFALSFNVLFPGTNPFSHFFYSMLKCIVMFIGEVDYQGTFYDEDDKNSQGPFIGHLLYGSFVLIVSVVLMNLLVGLTVSDIQKLQKEAELTRIFRQVSEMITLESVCFSKVIPAFFKRFLHKRLCLTAQLTNYNENDAQQKTEDSQHPLISRTKFFLKPNDPGETNVPQKLKDTLLQIALNNYHRQPCTENRSR